MEIRYFDALDSTQKQLLEDLRKQKIKAPIAYFTTMQYKGIGSRGSRWIGERGNFFLSFAIRQEDLPTDLPLESASIYYSFLLKELLSSKGSSIYLKWPNDFYLQKKVGGCITQCTQGVVVVGIGLNVATAPKGFDKLDIRVDSYALCHEFVKTLESNISWKQIFSKYKIEFQKSKGFKVHTKKGLLSLENATLIEDGAIVIDGERIYSLR